MAPALCLHWHVAPSGIAELRIESCEPSAGRPPLRSLQDLVDAIQSACDALSRRENLVGCVLLLDFTSPPLFPTTESRVEFPSASQPGGPDPHQAAATYRARQAVVRGLAELAVPVVAGVSGTCHGPWAELASWCDRRLVAEEDTLVGFPAVRRGEIPSLGGTARIPRLIAWRRAVDWLASGDLLDSSALVEAGWANRSVSRASLVEECAAQAMQLADAGTWRGERQALAGPYFTGETPGEQTSEPAGEQVVACALERLRSAVQGHEPVARLVGQLVVQAVRTDLVQACDEEIQATLRLAGSPVQRALERVAALGDHYSSLGTSDLFRRTETLAVVGAGLMGAGIAAIALRHGLRVSLVDADADTLRRARDAVIDEVAHDHRLPGIASARRSEVAERLRAYRSIDELPACDAVIEAVVENPDVKRQVLLQLESRLAAGGIIASNTSTIPIARLVERLAHPDRCCGMHFFNPVRIMPLVEVIRGAASSDETIADAVALARRIGKMPIVVRDSPGFLVNRLLFAYLNEAIQLLHEGTTIERIDAAARAFGMPVGPIELCDIIGLDTVFYAGRTMYAAFPDRTLASPIPSAFMKAGRMGRKMGAGFLVYDQPDGPGRADEITAGILARYQRGQRSTTDDELTWRLVLPMLLEATRVLEEGVVADVRDVDFGVIHGLGFPAYRGGLIYWAESLGRDELLRRLAPFAPLGARWQPTPRLLGLRSHDTMVGE